MIISASRRTDIPAFYAKWFINRIRAEYCTVPNPFNRNQVSLVSLKPIDVDVIVFWTRNPRPLFPYLKELDERGYRYYFQFTVMNNPRQIDPKSPTIDAGIDAYKKLAELIGPQRLIWRYDPIVFSSITGPDFHLRQYERIASALNGCTFRSVISIMDEYPKASKRLRLMSDSGAKLIQSNPKESTDIRECIEGIVSIASKNGMEIFSCAEELDLSYLGVLPGKCVDNEYIQHTFGITVESKKDPSQRKVCGCVVSKDIGMYDSCLFGCQYCYATKSFEAAEKNHSEHNSDSPSLIGWYEAQKAKEETQPGQLSLF
jgi:hypothetical protein